MKIKMNHVFKPAGEKLQFVGDFESLYKSEDDPWEQSGETGKMGLYYTHSRGRLCTQLKKINPGTLLEIGSGLGYKLNVIQKHFPDCRGTGMDISQTATERATKLFPHLDFIVGDIKAPDLNYFNLEEEYDVVILSQLLWYVLEDLPQVFENCLSALSTNGKLVICQAFLKAPQKYGKNICDGFEGLLQILKNSKLNVEYCHLDDSDSFIHNDGIVILSRKQ